MKISFYQMLVSIFDTPHCVYYWGVVVRTLLSLISSDPVILSVSSFHSVEVVGRFLIPDTEGGPVSTREMRWRLRRFCFEGGGGSGFV